MLLAATFTAVAGLVVALLYVFFLQPKLITVWIMALTRWLAGVQRRMVRVGRIKWTYAERGHVSPGGSTVVLVHGFSAARDSWNMVIKDLPALTHIIAVDLPGHGETEEDPKEDLRRPYEYYVSGLHEFLRAIGLKDQPIHLVGLSMGGGIVGVYAAAFPKNVKLLTLICPAMKTPVLSKMLTDKQAGLIHKTAEDFQRSMKYIVYKPFKFPKQVYQGFIDFRKKYIPFFEKLLNQIKEPENEMSLNNAMSNISAPAHILWGQEDYIGVDLKKREKNSNTEIVDVSGAPVLKEGIRDVRQYDIIPKCGHAMDLEKPELVAERIVHFRKTETQ